VSSFGDTLYDNLKDLLENREKLYRIAGQGREYVEKYHDSIPVVKQIIRWVEEQPKDEMIQPLHQL